MKKKHLIVSMAVAVLALGSSQTANAVLIDFETLPGGGAIAAGTAISTQFASVGVALFDSASSAPEIFQFSLAGQSGVNALGGQPGFTNLIDIWFVAPVSNVSLLGLDIGFNGLILEAFDSGGISLGSDSLVRPGVDGTGFADLLAVNLAGISHVQIRQMTSSAGDGYLIDDLRFDTSSAPIPEPASMTLLCLGIAGMAFRARKKMSA